jgi:hypothetical protein
MKLRQRRSYFAVAIGLLAIVAAAALAASGLAGSAMVTFTGVSLPPTVSQGGQGSVKGEVTAPKGITHGTLTITLPAAFTSPVCTPSCTSLGGNAFGFDFSLAAGKVYAAFVTYQVPAGTALGALTVGYSLSWDNGNGGQGESNGPEQRSSAVNIVGPNGTGNAAGTCSTLSGGSTASVFTLQDVNNSNKQSTQVQFGAAAASPLGYTFPCTGVFVLEKGPFAEGRSERSVFNGPKFATPSNLTVKFYGYTKALALTVYTDPDDPNTGTPVQNCPLTSGQKVCLVGWQKVANVMIASLLYAGGDPGLDGV